MAADTQDPVDYSLDPVVDEAIKRFRMCSEWESSARERILNDAKFAEGDSDNGFQWPHAIKRARDVESKPCLTMNVVHQHNLQIVNELKKNKSGMKFQATGNGATVASAKMFAAVGRHIEYMSNAAQAVYPIAAEWMVDCGIGYWRLVTDYVDDTSFDQEIFLKPINDPLSVYMDPDIKQRDGSDARFAFVFDLVPKKDLKDMYPDVDYTDSSSPLGANSGDGDFLMKDHVRVVEYFRKVFDKDELVSFIGTDGRRAQLRKSMMAKEMYEELSKEPLTKIRKLLVPKVEWYLIIGENVVDETTWVGKYIPIIRCVGRESKLEGILDIKGHTRTMKDAQRMFNYNSSAQVEFVALQGKTPWIAAVKSIEEYESYWGTANTVNHSVLPYNHIDDQGNVIPPPQRTEPPSASPAYQMGMDTAFNQMMMVSGQWQNQMGMMGNERTGAAIQKRQDQGDTATFHFADNYALAIRFTALQLVDLIPKIYDTRRVLLCYADDGEDFELEIDPASRQAYQQKVDWNGKVVRRIFNPNVGMYDVQGGVGNSYGTRREETVEALTLILTQAPQLTPIVGDILMAAMDFDKADEAAMRMKRMVPPQALGKGPSQQEQALQQQVAALQGALVKALDGHAKDKLKLAGKGEMRDIDVYKAETDRLKALITSMPPGEDGDGTLALVQQLVKDALATSLSPIMQENSQLVDVGNSGSGAVAPRANPLLPGQRVGADGRVYARNLGANPGYEAVATGPGPGQ